MQTSSQKAHPTPPPPPPPRAPPAMGQAPSHSDVPVCQAGVLLVGLMLGDAFCRAFMILPENKIITMGDHLLVCSMGEEGFRYKAWL